MTAHSGRAAAAAAARHMQTQKVLWTIYVGAAKDLDHGPARLSNATLTFPVRADGSFDATFEQLGEVANTDKRGARKFARKLAAQRYWTVTKKRGTTGTFTFAIITQPEREQLYYDAERQWHSECHKRDVEKRLEVEVAAKHNFTMPIYDAMARRARAAGVDDPYTLAIAVAEKAWAERANVQAPEAVVAQIADLSDDQVVGLAERLGFHAQRRKTDTSGARNGTSGAQDDTSGAQRDTSGPTEDTSGARKCPLSSDNANDNEPSSFSSFSSLSTAPAAPRAGGARSADAPAFHVCDLCGGSDIVAEAHMVGEDGDIAFIDCQHHWAANITEARRIELESDGFWTVKWAAHDIGEAENGGGIIDVARSRESYSALGHSE